MILALVVLFFASTAFAADCQKEYIPFSRCNQKLPDVGPVLTEQEYEQWKKIEDNWLKCVSENEPQCEAIQNFIKNKKTTFELMKKLVNVPCAAKGEYEKMKNACDKRGESLSCEDFNQCLLDKVTKNDACKPEDVTEFKKALETIKELCLMRADAGSTKMPRF